MSERYQQSEAMLKRALKSIPLGSQTFSKSKTQYPLGVSPFFIEKGKGSRVWDVDGNEYIDFVNALGAVTLGYNDEDVNAEVLKQMEKGVSFSLAHPLETELAEKIIELVPCAEMVRFGKNGSDATAGAVRLARAYTGREHVAVCGYHGWQDWYIGSTARNMGVPESTRSLTHSFEYNNPNSLLEIFKQWPEQVAAVILEPMSTEWPEDNFLEKVKEISHRFGAILIFDEMVTGFRLARGGAGEYFGVVPDLATFGKGLANGYPLSAIVGKAEIMALMEEIFFSFTYGGESLSLAAALATLEKFEREPVIETIKNRGESILEGLQVLIKDFALESYLSLLGHPSVSFVAFHDQAPLSQWELRTLFLQEMLARGVLIIGSHNMSYSHSADDVKDLLQAYKETLAILRDAVDAGSANDFLHCPVLEPLFRVR